LITRFVVENQKFVGFSDVIGQPKSNRTSQEIVYSAKHIAFVAGANSFVVMNDLYDTMAIEMLDCLRDLRNVCRIGHIDGVPSAIEAKDKSLHVTSSPSEAT
jgi:hypothetical protein